VIFSAKLQLFFYVRKPYAHIAQLLHFFDEKSHKADAFHAAE